MKDNPPGLLPPHMADQFGASSRLQCGTIRRKLPPHLIA
jgi:hypothetical protein